MRTLTLFALALILCTCAPAPEAATESSSSLPAATAGEEFGAAFEAEEVLPTETLLTTYTVDALADTVTTTLQGTVNEVCQAKGCWMTIAAGDGEEMMVKFKDYGFFVPKDISGRDVIMHGIAYYQETSVEELRHYAEDAGKSEDEIAAITEPKRELHFLADGVRVL